MDRISGQMALTCQAGFYYDSRTEECRNCDFVCGDQYGGHEQRECRDTCPGYGISTTTTTSAPADDSVKVMWIVGGFFAGLAIIVIVAIALSCLKMKRCSWKPQPKPIVHEESLEGLVGKSVIAVERSVSCEQTRAPLPLGFQSRTATSPI